jgi:DNA-binding transcriptional regulator YiaG
MPETSGIVGVRDVVDAVTAAPGMSRAAAARALHCRRVIALELVGQALAADLIHEDESTVAIRGRARRTVTGLYPGPAARALFAEPTLSGKQLRAARERAGVPPGVMARHLHISPAQLRRWETGAQILPARMHLLVTDALETAQDEIAQAALRPAKVREPRPAPERSNRRTDAHRLARLLSQIDDHPGRSRWDLVRTRTIDRRLLERALEAGQVHEAPTWTPRSRQPVVGVFPGTAPSAVLPEVLVADLVAARVAVGWSQDVVANRLGVARPTWARWERESDVVPGWASAAAAAALREAQAAPVAIHPRDRIAAAVQTVPGSTWGEAIAAAGFSKNPAARRYVSELLAAGRVHQRWRGERGQRHGWLHPGPAPVDVLTGQQLRERRHAAGLLQRDLAALADTDLGSVRAWEQGLRRIPEHRQFQLDELLAAQPDAPGRAHAALLTAVLAVIREQPRNRYQLELLNLASRGELTAVLDVLVASGEIHVGRIGAGIVNARGQVSRGRVGYLNGPGPVGA